MQSEKLKNSCKNLFTFLPLIIILYSSCTKLDSPKEIFKNDIQKFLRLPKNSNPALLRIADDMRKKNEANPFIEQLIRTQGFPDWENAIFKRKNSYTSRENESNDTIVLLPFILINQQYVNSFLDCNLNGEILYKFFHGDNYLSYGWNKSTNRLEPNAEDVAKMIMTMEKEIFGGNKFKIFNNQLLTITNESPTSTRFVQLTARDPEEEDGVCYEWWQTVSTDGGATFHDVEPPVFLGFTGDCGEDDSGTLIWYLTENEPPIGVGGGSNPNSSPQCLRGWFRIPIPVPGTYIPPADPCGYIPQSPVNVNSIENYLTDPCKISAFDKLTSTRLKNCLFNLYSQSFVGNNSTHNLRIEEVPIIPLPNGGMAPAASTNPLNLPNTWVILLSSSLPHLTQELWGSLILHELVHGFIRKNNLSFYPSSAFSDLHAIMLNNWILEIKEALKESFNISDEDALALSLEGFDDVLRQETSNTFISDMKTWMHNLYGVDLNQMSNIADDYYSGTKGTRCQ